MSAAGIPAHPPATCHGETIRVLVLGGEGSLGHMVAGVLNHAPGVATYFTSRQPTNDGLRFDVTDGVPALKRLMYKLGRVEYVVNCIGILSSDIVEHAPDSVQAAIHVNALFPHQLEAVARSVGTHVIHMSTDGVFQPDAGMCFEDTPANGSGPYSQTKRLGEVESPVVVNVRCSIVGPDPRHHRGLIEWLRDHSPGGVVHGYVNHAWNGVTTLQFAHLCQWVILGQRFGGIRRAGPTHHFCPNAPVTKYDLLCLLNAAFGLRLLVRERYARGRVNRVLGTRHPGLLYPQAQAIPMSQAISELATYCEGGQALGAIGHETASAAPATTTRNC